MLNKSTRIINKNWVFVQRMSNTIINIVKFSWFLYKSSKHSVNRCIRVSLIMVLCFLSVNWFFDTGTIIIRTMALFHTNKNRKNFFQKLTFFDIKIYQKIQILFLFLYGKLHISTNSDYFAREILQFPIIFMLMIFVLTNSFKSPRSELVNSQVSQYMCFVRKKFVDFLCFFL